MLERELTTPLFRLGMVFDPAWVFGRIRATSQAPAFHTLTIALLASIGYYAGSQIGFLLTPAYTPISIFWPPNAILLAILLLTSPRIWWLLVLAVLPAHLLIQLRMGLPVISVLGWFVGNAGEALLGAACVRVFKGDKPLFESLRGVAVFLAWGTLLPTLVTSFVDAGGARLTGLGQNYWNLWTSRLTSNIVSDLTIVPIIVIFGISGVSLLSRMSLARYLEAGALTIGVAAASLLVFSSESSVNGIPAISYLPLLLLVWAAVRFGCGGVSVSMLVLALISLWNTVHGRGPLGAQATANAVISIRLLLIVFSVPLMLLAALLTEREGDEGTLRATRQNLIYAQEQENYRIARELHTDIAGRLALVAVTVDRFRAESNTSLRAGLDQLHGEVSRVFQDTLDLSHDVHPFMVEYLGLAKALNKLCRDTGTKSATVINYSAENASLLLPPEVSYRLFRVAKATLGNLVQHTAKEAAVELKVRGGRVQLRIAANVTDLDRGRREGMGLGWMREQVRSVQGTLTITSAPNQGTVIEASVPIHVSA